MKISRNILGSVILTITFLASLNAFAFTSVCERSAAVRKFIENAYPFKTCDQITEGDVSKVEGILERFDDTFKEILVRDFEGLRSLEKINISWLDIEKIEKGAFKDLSSLKEMNLILTNLPQDLESGIFEGLTSLETLRIHSAGINKVEMGVFDGLRNIRRLELTGLKVEYIEPGVFDSLTKLQWLDLQGDKIQKISSDMFDKLTGLEVLVLFNSEIQTIDVGAFKTLCNLRILDLRYNRLSVAERVKVRGNLCPDFDDEKIAEVLSIGDQKE